MYAIKAELLLLEDDEEELLDEEQEDEELQVIVYEYFVTYIGHFDARFRKKVSRFCCVSVLSIPTAFTPFSATVSNVPLEV
jgi:hypothetical protein